MFERLGLIAYGILAVACATRTAAPLAAPLRFDSQQACYRCLKALVEREKISDDGLRDDRLVLLVVRARELGLDDGPWLKALTSGVSATSARRTLLPLVEMLHSWPRDVSGWPPDARLPQARRVQALREEAAKAEQLIMEAGLSEPVTRYLRQSLQCRVLRTEATPAEMQAWSADPLLAYGATACIGGASNEVRARLEALVASNGGWVEADVALARLDITGRRMSQDAERRLTRATAEFPESAALWLALAQLRQARADLQPALEAYEAVVARVPDHREALLGKTICLSHLSRHAEAIDTASRIIDLGAFHVGEALYWRGWNQYRLSRLDGAWADSERALGLLYGTDAFTLSGLVALARDEPVTAQRQFEKAVALNGANCTAHTQLGASLVRQQRWEAAGPAFDAAVRCHHDEVMTRRRELDDVRARGDSSAAHLKSIEDAVASAGQAEAEASLEAAGAFLRSHHPDRALEALAPARRHPSTRARAETLAVLAKRP